MCPFAGRHGSSICSTPCNLILLNWINPGWSCCHVTNQDVFLATSLGIVLKAQTISTCKLSSESRHHEANEWEFWKPGPFQNPSKTREALSWTRKNTCFPSVKWNHWNHGNLSCYPPPNDRKQNTKNGRIPFGRSRPCFFQSWFTG